MGNLCPALSQGSPRCQTLLCVRVCLWRGRWYPVPVFPCIPSLLQTPGQPHVQAGRGQDTASQSRPECWDRENQDPGAEKWDKPTAPLQLPPSRARTQSSTVSAPDSTSPFPFSAPGSSAGLTVREPSPGGCPGSDGVPGCGGSVVFSLFFFFFCCFFSFRSCSFSSRDSSAACGHSPSAGPPPSAPTPRRSRALPTCDPAGTGTAASGPAPGRKRA